MTPWLQDQDLTVWCGDALDVLRGMADGSVDCVVTSPPYWGLRDYGTGEWEGGDPDCDHLGRPHSTQAGFNERYFGKPSGTDKQGELREPFRDICGKCGARRVDRQLGLEPTPDHYVQNMVAVFREVRRVLASYGTCWVNLGDSYAGGGYSNHDGTGGAQREDGGKQAHTRSTTLGLKPKDLVGIPWRAAFALQADGWWLRSDIIWAKPNPMPESVTDRPTKSHEFVFLLTKGARYWFDAEAVREPSGTTWNSAKGFSANGKRAAATGYDLHANQFRERPEHDVIQSGRNVRSVWHIATQQYPEAHFATFPEELARRCIVAGCPEWVCGVCGKPRERIIEATAPDGRKAVMRGGKAYDENGDPLMGDNMIDHGVRGSWNSGGVVLERSTLGWSDCGHHAYRPGVVLDPFGGSGTVAAVARKHGRRAVLIELNETYCQLIARRTAQQSLLA